MTPDEQMTEARRTSHMVGNVIAGTFLLAFGALVGVLVWLAVTR